MNRVPDLNEIREVSKENHGPMLDFEDIREVSIENHGPMPDSYVTRGV